MSYQSVVSAQSPSKYFRLQDALTDEQGGSAFVRSGGAAQPQYATGYVDTAPRGLSFDGGDAGYISGVAWGSSKASVTFWFKPTSYSSVQVWFESSADYNGAAAFANEARMVAYSDGTNLNVNVASMGTGNATNEYDTTLWPLPSAGTWTHVACVFDMSASTTGRIKVYYNGSLQTVSSPSWGSRNIPFGTQDLCIMARNQIQYFQAAVLDDLALWGGTALTSTQVLDQYNAGLPAGGSVARRRRPVGLYTR